MKKSLVFLFIIFVLIVSSKNVFSQDEGVNSGMPISEEQFDKIAEKVDQVNNVATQNWSYVKQEWRKTLERNPIGRILLKINDNLEKSKFIESIIGLPYSFSFKFFFAFILWVAFLLLFFPPLSQILGSNKFLGLLASFAVTSLIGLTDVFKKASEMINLVIKNKWLGWLALFVTILIAILFFGIGSNIKDKLKKMKEEAEKEQVKRDREILHTTAEIAKKEFSEE